VRALRLAGYRTITFAQYLDYRAGRGQLPRRPILLTFDDGYATVFETAFPVLQRAGFVATIFIVTGQINGTNVWDADERQQRLLSAEQIRALHGAGFEIQSHTVNHARLPDVSADVAFSELVDSRTDLERLLGVPVRVICYPFAAHTAAVETLAASAGYELGVTIRRRLNRDATNPFALRRIAVTYRTSVARLAWDLYRLRFHGD
jgi:peptidoglycan/xylan/chitin deacetylase (PgdA/CDA1 family)